jgi:hypothetical protein
MASIQVCPVCPLPDDALLAAYQRHGAYTDCYATEVFRSVSHAQYVEAFYTGSVFKIERLLLSWFASRPSTDAQARELACGTLGTFSAWRVEARTADQLLMCDLSGRTRSWLMAAPVHATTSTRLYFGSAVVPVRRQGGSGTPTMGFPFKALLGFHKLYSRVLLGAARSRLASSTTTGA